MKLTLANVKRIKAETTSQLTKRVCKYVIDHWSGYTNKEDIFIDVLNHGCQSGIVPELIYYTDTTRFYKQYKEEINELLYSLTTECGITNLTRLFGKNWDEEDPLAMYDYNQNLLAWFGFEEALRNLAYEFESLRDYV